MAQEREKWDVIIVGAGPSGPLFDESVFRWVPKLPRVKMSAWPMPFSTYGESVGRYNVSFLIQASWDQLPDLFAVRDAKVREQINKWFELFEQDIDEIFPELKKHTIWKMRQAATYNISETPGYVGKHRPGVQPPRVKNLYLCSDTLREARIGGTQAAAIPMVMCADLILGNPRMPRTMSGKLQKNRVREQYADLPQKTKKVR